MSIAELSRPLIAAALVVAVFSNCGAPPRPGVDGGSGAGGGSAGGGSAGGGSADGGLDGGSTVPMIGAALSCKNTNGVGGLLNGTGLQRRDLDLAAFPNAVCNDGTGAVFYFRPAITTAARNLWVIQLQGGGSCGSPAACANRWCSAGTNFSAKQMTSDVAPMTGIVADGILDQTQATNPFLEWNQVFIRYCSSDTWSGTGRDVVVTAPNPADTTQMKTFRMHFEGRNIFDAVLATLRRDPGGTINFTLGGASSALPDLDDATQVVLAGASAGGSGTVNNLDHMTQVLRTHNTACSGASCPLVTRGITDSFGFPSLENANWAGSTVCTSGGLCTFQQHLEGPETAEAVLWVAKGDDSCGSWHQANAPTTAYKCRDGNHVLTHHVTTPFFARMGQTDSLIGQGRVDTLLFPNIMAFASAVRTELTQLPGIINTAEEAAGLTVAPGAFGPSCDKHETIGNTPATFDVTITKGATTHRMFDVYSRWVAGTMPPVVVAQQGDTVNCP